MLKPFQAFGKGIKYAFQGMVLIRRHEIRPLVIAPLAINALLFLIWMGLGIAWMPDLIAEALSRLPDFLQWLSWLLWPLLLLLLILSGGFTCLLLSGLIAAPFAAPLTRAVAVMLGVVREESGFNLRRAFSETGLALRGEVRKLFYFSLLSLPVFLISLVPVAQIVIAPLLWILVSGWMLALEFADYPLGLFGKTFTEQRQVVRDNRYLFLGFGLTVLVIAMIPVINLMAFPSAITGMTALVCSEGIATDTGNPEARP